MVVIIVLFTLVLWSNNIINSAQQSEANIKDQNDIPIPMDRYPESPWRTPATLAARVITSTPFARFEIHKVRTETGEIVNDWLWTDERSHVNILVNGMKYYPHILRRYSHSFQVHLKQEDKYLLFHQKKYGLSGAAYATVGGLFNEGETAQECATRELLEETGLAAEELVSLGSYRVQVNRGGGILHAFLARNCFPSPQRKKKSDDYETQEVRKLTRKELLQVALNGEVGEAQWVATVALGILHEEHGSAGGGVNPRHVV
jgi:ADP-ribose pyrophosphatase YjhB (NUDIX family)